MAKRSAFKLKIKKGDKVRVIAGSFKGTEGEVLEIHPGTNRAIVENVNVAKKHAKPTNERAGGIREINNPVHLSNLMLIDPKNGESHKNWTSRREWKVGAVRQEIGRNSKIMGYEPRLWKHYREEIVPKLMKEFSYGSVMEVPKLVKICINQGVGQATQDKKLVDNALEEMTLIAGQKAVPTKAKKSVSNFKLREGMTIGARVTLRRDMMFDFLDRLVAVALPRVRDFRGINDKSFDGRG